MAEKYKDVDAQQLQSVLQYARVIHKQKDVERINFEGLEALIDYPRAENAKVEAPSSSDMSEVSKSIQLFRPVDFDELIEERRLADRCGYVLCPQKLTTQEMNRRLGSLRLRGALRSANADPWCSVKCVRRAAFLRFQLKAEPGWLRSSSDFVEYHFPVGDIDPSQPMSDIHSVRPKNVPNAERLPTLTMMDAAARAVPRGDRAELGNQSRSILSDSVVERSSTRLAEQQGTSDTENAYNAIEGYVI